MSSRALACSGSILLTLASACHATHAPAETKSAARTTGVVAAPAAFDVENYDLRIELDPSRRSIHARCTIRLWPVVDALQSVALDFEGFDVKGIADSAGRPLKWTRSDGTLNVALSAPVARGDFAEFTVEYAGHPERGMWFARERDRSPTQVFTHGQCRDARAWFPCHDEPTERATSEIRVTMPRAWTSIAAGEKIERVEAGDHATELWRMTFPHPAYLETLVAGELRIENEEWDGIPLVFAGANELAENMRHAFAETDEVLSFMSSITGARFPYAKYAQVCVDNFPSGGMENISATTLSDAFLPDEQGLADEPGLELLAHEAAHQWFGDLLTCADWSHVWLNEGFATYFAALYTEHSRGVESFAREMRGIREAYLARDVGPNRRPLVYGTDGDPLELFFTGHVYQGGAIRLHHLRSVLGDDAFFRGVREYVAANRGRGVVTNDLRAAMERASGIDLRWFFEQWFEKPGHPEVRAAWDYSKAGQRVVLELEQTQESGSATPAVFRLPLDVEVRTRAGAKIERVTFEARKQRFEFACDEAPDWVRVDPADHVPMRLTERMPTRAWVAMSSESDANGRVRALDVLSSALLGTTLTTEWATVASVVRERLAHDGSAEARAICARALSIAPAHAAQQSESSRAEARAELVRAASRDADLGVRLAALESLRSFAPDADLARFAHAELAHASGWKVRGALAALVVRHEPGSAFAFLAHELEAGSAHGTYEAAVLKELGSTGDPRAHAILVDWVRDATKPDAARAVAVRTLSRPRLNDEDARTAIIELLDSPRVRLRREAIAALNFSSDPSSRSALERFIRTSLIPSERRAAEKALAHTATDA